MKVTVKTPPKILVKQNTLTPLLEGGGIDIVDNVVSHADTSSVANTNNSGSYSAIQNISVDQYGHVVSIQSADITAVEIDTLDSVLARGNTTSRGIVVRTISANSSITSPLIVGNVQGTVSDISNFSTDNLDEGNTNLYYTSTRVNNAIDARITKSLIDALGIDASTIQSRNLSFLLDYNNHTNTPSSITDFGISDGANGHVLTTDGNGNFSFEALPPDPVIPTSILDLDVTDGSNNSVLFTDGNGGFIFRDLPTIPTSILDLDVTDGPNNSVLFTDGNGGFIFRDLPTIPTSILDLDVTDGSNNSVLFTDGNGGFSFRTIPEQITQFVSLSDTFASYVGKGNQLVVVNASETGLSTVAQSVIPTSLLDLDVMDGANGSVLTTDGNGGFAFEPTQYVSSAVVRYSDRTYTLSNHDFTGKTTVLMSSNSVNIVSIPLNLSVNEPVTIVQYGTGQTNIYAASGVTIQSADGYNALRTQYSTAIIIPIDQDVYLLSGDLMQGSNTIFDTILSRDTTTVTIEQLADSWVAGITRTSNTSSVTISEL